MKRKTRSRGRRALAVSVPGALAALLALGACAKAPAPPTETEVARAQAALGPLKKGLMGALKEALPNGPESAISVCRDVAPKIARSSSVGGVKVGRTSHRLRNPKNAPPAWAEELLAAYVADPTKSEGTAVRLANGGVGWVEPIVTAELCLTCHGPDVAPSIRATLEELYPMDAATGFESGDLRGLFWATVPSETSAEVTSEPDHGGEDG